MVLLINNEENFIDTELFAGNPDYGDHVEKLYRFSNYVQSLFVVPCIAAQVWLQGSINPSDVAYLHAALPLVPLALYLAKKERRELAEIIIALNLASMAVVSFLGKRYYGIAAAVSFAINYFVIKDEGDVIDAIPAQDLFNYGMVFAAYFALKGLRGE